MLPYDHPGSATESPFDAQSLTPAALSCPGEASSFKSNVLDTTTNASAVAQDNKPTGLDASLLQHTRHKQRPKMSASTHSTH